MLKSLNKFFLIIIISTLFILIGELLLWSLWSLTKSSKLDTLEGNRVFKIYHSLKFNSYPSNPENYLKIAVYGGSSAEGTVEFNFSNVINHDLKKIIGPNIFIKNYGESGNSFHKEQAEILKKTIPFYDIFVIYSGHNEWVNIYNQDCGIKIFNINIKLCKEIEANRNKKISHATNEFYNNKSNKFNLFQFLESKSRIYAIMHKSEYYLSNYLSKKLFKNKKIKDGSIFQETGLIRPAKSEPNKAFSSKKIEEIPKKFDSDLKEIIKTIQKEKKFLILVGAIGNELFPPYFSQHSASLDSNNVDFLNNKLQEVEKNINNKDLHMAQKQVEEILINEPKHAYANFLMGKINMYLGKMETSWSYFEKAVDEDGFPHRNLSTINLLLKKQAEKNKANVSYINYPKIVRKLITNNESNESFFVDWVHPNNLGHIIIGKLASCEIAKHIKLPISEKKTYCKQTINKDSLDTMYNYYKQKFNITENNIIETRKVIFRWAILLSRISAHPEYFYKTAKQNLKYYYSKYESDEKEKVKYLVLYSFLSLAQGKNCEAVQDLVYQAYTTSPKIFHQTLEDPFPFPERNIDVKNIFKLSGLNIENLDTNRQSKILCNN